ncbi:AEC family transporter [Flavobacterium sp. UBA6135]|uniref:AEC family transporter n=1 Tax=Flavobacterium sp. UBA6135 TaxID=1946553 RepID=UPI0025C624B5|nr:AEC family transporter [Flavobacterium sp. UBA6135]
MENIILLFLCLALGVGLRYIKSFPINGHIALNHFVIYISLPSLALYYIPKIEISSKLLFPLGIAWLGFALSFLFFSILQKWLGWSKKLTGCLVITGGLSNTAFIGYPVSEALYGKEGLQTAIFVDQPGSFVVTATLAVAAAVYFSKGETNTKSIVSKILLFPPFISFLIACFLNLFQTDFPELMQTVFLKLGSTVTAIALVAVGLQLKIDKNSQHWNFLTLGLFFKLFLMPAFFLLLYKIILGADGVQIDVSIMQSAMAPMITGSILASTYGLKPKLSSMMVGVGIPLSFLTLAFWYWVLTMI